MFSARLVAYEPAGARLESLLLDSVSWDASLPLNDVSALSLSYPAVFDTAGLAGGPVEVAVEVSDGGAWVEPRNARFLSSELQANLTEELDVPKFTLRGLGSLLERCFVLRPDENPGKPYTSDEDDPKRNFLSATVGQILTGVVTEARSKYPTMLQGVTLGFTAGKDSLGNGWDKLDSVAYSPETDLLRILDDMVGRGVADWWMQGRVLHAVNAESAATTRTLRLLLGDAKEAPLRATFENLATHVEVAGGQGKRWARTVPGAVVPYGARVVRVSNESVTTEGTALDLIARQQAQSVVPRREYTRAIVDTNRQPPLFAWSVGDWVQAENGSGQYEQVRVFEAGIAFDASAATVEARVTLNDRFVDASVRDAKRLQGITHGATQILGDGGIPSRVDKAVPAAPVGVTANSLGYWDSATAFASVDVSWQAVTVSVDGLALSGIDHYEAQCAGQTQRTTGTTAGFDGLPPGKVVSVQVRAISSTGIVGPWSTVVQVVTGVPTAKLDPPTTPTFTSENNSIQVKWNGLLQGVGAVYAPPQHFSYVLVETRLLGESEWVRYPQDSGWVQTGLAVGTTWETRLVAVDLRGVESDPSPTGSVTVKSKAQQALDDLLVTKEDVEAAQTTANGANARLFRNWGATKPLVRVNGTPLMQGDELVTRKDGMSVQVEVWNGTTWTDSYLLAAQLFVLSSQGTISLGEGVVDAPQIKAGALNYKTATGLEITSGLFQTSALANTGVKIDTANGLRAYQGGNLGVQISPSIKNAIAVRSPAGTMVPLSDAAFGTHAVVATDSLAYSVPARETAVWTRHTADTLVLTFTAWGTQAIIDWSQQWGINRGSVGATLFILARLNVNGTDLVAANTGPQGDKQNVYPASSSNDAVLAQTWLRGMTVLPTVPGTQYTIMLRFTTLTRIAPTANIVLVNRAIRVQQIP